MKSCAQFADEAADDVAARATNLGLSLNPSERVAISDAIYRALNSATVRKQSEQPYLGQEPEHKEKLWPSK